MFVVNLNDVLTEATLPETGLINKDPCVEFVDDADITNAVALDVEFIDSMYEPFANNDIFEEVS